MLTLHDTAVLLIIWIANWRDGFQCAKCVGHYSQYSEHKNVLCDKIILLYNEIIFLKSICCFVYKIIGTYKFFQLIPGDFMIWWNLV